MFLPKCRYFSQGLSPIILIIQYPQLMQYAAFIMTFKRTNSLGQTIDKLRLQSAPPAHILIIDNDPERSADLVSREKNCEYFAVGYNSGPAGAAYHGLKILFEQGWNWVLWVDDDDPPVFDNQIERLIELVENLPAERMRCKG